jgi:D-lactate dehydrogenase
LGFRRAGTTLLGSTCTIALATVFLFSLGTASFLYAIHTKSEMGEKNHPAQDRKMGNLSEVERGPRGKNEISLTFDAGAKAECFDDLITALANAHASSTFFIAGKFVHDHAECAAVKVAVFSAKNYDREFLTSANESRHELYFFDPHLSEQTVELAEGFRAVCIFVNDNVDAHVAARLASLRVRLIALRCAGYNNVDLTAAKKYDITVVRVPGYSPYAVAEHTIGLMLALNRKLHRAYNRVREGNFTLDGLLGFDFHGKAVGIIGTGKIGTVVAQILTGFGCPTLAFDPIPNEKCQCLGARYVTLDELLAQSDIVTLHCPLTLENKHMFDARALEKMKTGVMLINTSRGRLLDTVAVIDALKKGKIGYLGLDVYEEEEQIFFEDRSGLIIPDDVFARGY